MQGVTDKIDAALLKIEEPLTFKTGLQFGKEKLDEYWYKLIHQTPYYYAAVILHPGLQLAWIEDSWRRYPAWIKTVKLGMKKFVLDYVRRLEEATGRPEP